METILNPVSPFEKRRKWNTGRQTDACSKKIALDYSGKRTLKRLFDIVISLVVILAVLSWLVPLLGLIIAWTSKGPVFFLQKRNGRNGKAFTCIKLRTMLVNEQSETTPCYEGDVRITAFGKILRRYYIDELPQFINVLMGSMTTVGPRPHMIFENMTYESILPDYRFRYRVKPGITCLSQLQSSRHASPLEKMADRISWDIYYIKNWSFTLDLRIILKTLVFVVHK
jgi:putative colanic acid biosynthesis UDP-glucose lipid carrier transferase